jgi:uncharacterized protein YndB with AHSA1/START domain
MDPNLSFDFSINKEDRRILVKREFAATLPLVWDAWTKAEILDQWWAPKPWKSETKSMEFKEGGTRLYAMVGPQGERHWAIFRFDRIEPQKYFSGLTGFSDAEGVINSQMPVAPWEVSFTDKGNTTLVETLITFDSLEDMEVLMQTGFKEGFTIALQGLEDILPTLRP